MRTTIARAVALVACAGLLLAAACRPPATRRDHDHGRTASSPSGPDRVARGAVLYAAYCAGCHGPDGRGHGPVARMINVTPTDLRAPGLLDRVSDRELVERLLHGTALRTSRPHSPIADELQTDALAAYIPTLSSTNWAMLRVGRFTFESACAPCHGAYGNGEGVLGAQDSPPPADLVLARERYTDAALAQVAVKGVRNMPPAADRLDPGQMRALVAYVRHLSKGYRLYDTYCASCHGDDGRGVAAEDRLSPAIAAPVLGAQTPQRLGPTAYHARILHMLRREQGLMPHFRDTVDEEQLGAILAYLRSGKR